ncbi:MAG TPA: FeoA family protein [Candidatus Bathyarchaeia archaeon]|nr:FeoA family protein [Candidatus Bathyarchaeia archaeon]
MRLFQSREPDNVGFGRGRHRRRHRHGILIPVTELHPGQRGLIAAVKASPRVAQRLADLGLTPETSVCVVKTAPFNGPVEIVVRGSKLAIGREIAQSILVKTKGS